MKDGIVVRPEAMPVVYDLVAVVYTRLDANIATRVGDRPQRCGKDFNVADDYGPIVQVPDIVADLVLIIEKGPLHGNAVLAPFTGHGVLVVFVVARDYDSLLEVACAPVEKWVLLQATPFQVRDVTGQQQDVTALGERMRLYKPAVYAEFQVKVGCVLDSHLMASERFIGAS